MAIPTMSSQDYNNIIEQSQQKINNLDKKMTAIKKNIQGKLAIVRYEAEYANWQMDGLNDGAMIQDRKMKILSRAQAGQFEVYGSTVHPKFIKPPINVFNLKVSGTGEMFFRNDVSVAIDGKLEEENKNILKHDSVPSKEIFFKTYTEDVIRLEVAVDTSNVLGATRFNMIEIDSYLPGSYDIEKIEIYNIAEDGSLSADPQTYTSLLSMGKGRIIFGEKKKFYKVALTIRLNYTSDDGGGNVHPFGLKHLYFYDADFMNTSFVIVPLTEEKAISIIKEEIRVKTPFADANSELSKSIVASEGIQFYIDKVNDELETEVFASTPSQRNDIARNVSTVYARIPVVNRSLIGVAFEVETRG